MRIVAGKFRGRNLVKSDHLKLRPTTDKNREALFNILTSGKLGFEIRDSQILDMCCGTGAVGFEALSRGAKAVTFVDLSREHLEVVKKNSVLLEVENSCEILCADAKKLSQNNKQFDLVFVDPPYAEDYLVIVKNLVEKGWIGEKSLVVVESQTTKEELGFDGLQLVESRVYGATSFWFFLRNNFVILSVSEGSHEFKLQNSNS